MTGKTVLSFQEWEAQSGMGTEPQSTEMGMQKEPMMGGDEPSHEPVQPGMEIMPVEEPGDLSKMDEPEKTEEPNEADPMMMDYQ